MTLKKHFSSGNVIPDGPLPTKIQLFKVGENPSSKGTVVYKPEMKDIILSNQLLSDGRDLYPIDLEHMRGASQGWFSLTLDDTGVYADNIQWTKKGTQSLSDREFRFYSPTFYTDADNNVIQIDSLALTNSPALYDLAPLVASKEITKELKEMSIVTDKVEEFKAAVEEVMPEEEAPVDEKDKLILDLSSQNEALQIKLSEALSQLEVINQEALAKEKDSVVESIGFSSEAEKVFFSKMSIESLKEYAAIAATKKSVVVVETPEPIVPETKEFTKVTKPTPTVVNRGRALNSIPSLEQIQARANQIAGNRLVKK